MHLIGSVLQLTERRIITDNDATTLTVERFSEAVLKVILTIFGGGELGAKVEVVSG